MPKFAVVVNGICDVSTVVVVDSDSEFTAGFEALEAATRLPSDQWEHGEISVSDTDEVMKLNKATLHKAWNDLAPTLEHH